MRSGRRQQRRRWRLGAAGLVLLSSVLAATALPASAHIGVNPPSVPRGSEVATLRFEVPNESDTASTVKLEVQLPRRPAIDFVRVQPIAGWSVRYEPDGVAGDGIPTVVWEGGAIAPGEFQEFGIRIGPFPKKGKVVRFKAIQTYSDGEVSRWIQEPVKGTPEPQYPAPSITLTAKEESGH